MDKRKGMGQGMRDRLMELIQNAPRTDIVYGDIKLSEPVQTLQTIADHLLANGVIVQDHGHWTIMTDDYDCEYMVCSCCGEEFYNADEDTVDRTPKYCPNCGAKMDGLAEREGRG